MVLFFYPTCSDGAELKDYPQLRAMTGLFFGVSLQGERPKLRKLGPILGSCLSAHSCFSLWFPTCLLPSFRTPWNHEARRTESKILGNLPMLGRSLFLTSLLLSSWFLLILSQNLVRVSPFFLSFVDLRPAENEEQFRAFLREKGLLTGLTEPKVLPLFTSLQDRFLLSKEVLIFLSSFLIHYLQRIRSLAAAEKDIGRLKLVISTEMKNEPGLGLPQTACFAVLSRLFSWALGK